MPKCVHQVLLQAIHKQPKECWTEWATLFDAVKDVLTIGT